MFNYDAPETVTSSNQNWKPFEWGVHPIKITSFKVEESKQGTGFNINCDISGTEGKASRFVSLGWFRKIANADDDTAFQRGRKDVDNLNILQKEWFEAKRDGNENKVKAIEASRNSREQEARKNKFYLLARQMEDFVKFIAGFGNGNKFKDIPAGISQKQWLEEAMKLATENTEGAYVLLMTSPYIKEDKVYSNFSFTQNFQSPRSFYYNSVDKVEFVREELFDEYGTALTDGDGNKLTGDVAYCLVHFKKEGINPAKVRKNDKNCVPGESTPNDTATPSQAPSFNMLDTANVDDIQTDDLPF